MAEKTKSAFIGAFRVSSKDSERMEESSYIEKVAILIPAPVLSLYTAIKAMNNGTFDIGYLTYIGLAACVFWYCITTYKENSKNKIQWLNVILGTFAFPLWIYATGDYLKGIEFDNQQLVGQIAVSIYTWIAGIIAQKS